MINFLLSLWVKLLLWLRYRVEVRGARQVAAAGRRGILFLSNHTALIDPIILATYLHRRFHPKFLADRDQIDRPVVRWLARRVGVVPMPNIALYGRDSSEEVRQAVGQLIEHLRGGGNALLYPAGHLCRRRWEDLKGNSGVETVLREVPEARVVLVRQRGLWGSGFSWARGGLPDITGTLKRGLVGMLLSGVFFMPRRKVTLELEEAPDLPRDAGRDVLNRYLEGFYNADAPPAVEVPVSIWQRGGPHILPEPETAGPGVGVESVPPATREIVIEHLQELTGHRQLDEDAHLGRDLGLDSLSRAELLAWLQQQFGFAQGDTDALQTVGDVLLAACGHAASTTLRRFRPPSRKWFARRPDSKDAQLAPGRTVTEAFLNRAEADPGEVLLVDQASGARTYRDILTRVILLAERLRSLEGDRLCIMLPASVAADVVYMAALFAGKTPVMVNWTVGSRNLRHCLRLVDGRSVVTLRALVERLEAQGHDLAWLAPRMLFLEDVARQIPRTAKLKAFVSARVRKPRPVWDPSDTAVILFTSGSESLPKAVPLSHRNLLTNLKDVLTVVTVHEDDVILGILPPFHSFGLTATVLAPLLAGLPAMYHPDPTEAGVLAGLIEAYHVTVMAGTPTFLAGIVRAARPGQLCTLRLGITGAEKCSQRVYAALAQCCPEMTILEGYGATECSPIISLNDQHAPRPFTIGRVMPSLEHVVVDVSSGQRAVAGGIGVLQVRGPSVFGGYLGYDGPSPFVELEGRPWYRTGDLVSEDAEGVLTFHGRLKRFVKLGGEMISLPAIEAVLEPHYVPEGEHAPVLAVIEAGDESSPELVLFTMAEVDREQVNRQIRAGGLSALHNIRRVIRVEEIPVLGTGKTDYRALKEALPQ